MNLPRVGSQQLEPSFGRALILLNDESAERWRLERLSEEAWLSRSSLRERFVRSIGQPKLQYLTRRWMQLASAMLRDTNAKVIEIALEVGYESEAAFSRAFKRVVGVAPGAWRRRGAAGSRI